MTPGSSGSYARQAAEKAGAISLNGVSSVYTRHRVNQFGECILEARVGLFLVVRFKGARPLVCVLALLCYLRQLIQQKSPHFNLHSTHLELSVISAAVL